MPVPTKEAISSSAGSNGSITPSGSTTVNFGIATLDLVSGGRVDFGTGESSSEAELGGFGIPIEEKRKIYLEATEQIANAMFADSRETRMKRWPNCAIASMTPERSTMASSGTIIRSSSNRIEIACWPKGVD